MKAAPLGELFNRTFDLNLGGTSISSDSVDGTANDMLRCVFKIERGNDASANTAEISVYNLAEQTRSRVAEKGIETILAVGYSGRSSVIFRGKLEAGQNKREGVDWATTFQSTDGGRELRQARINKSFKTVSVTEAFQSVASALGVGLGNAIDKISEGNKRGTITDFANGLVLSGSARAELDRLVRTFGLDWSIQDGQIQLLGPRDAIEPGDAIVLDSDRGMIGSPESGEDGIVEVRSLLIPQLTPGRVVKLSSLQVSGFYRVENVSYQGDTRGSDWFADLELKPR